MSLTNTARNCDDIGHWIGFFTYEKSAAYANNLGTVNDDNDADDDAISSSKVCGSRFESVKDFPIKTSVRLS